MKNNVIFYVKQTRLLSLRGPNLMTVMVYVKEDSGCLKSKTRIEN